MLQGVAKKIEENKKNKIKCTFEKRERVHIKTPLHTQQDEYNEIRLGCKDTPHIDYRSKLAKNHVGKCFLVYLLKLNIFIPDDPATLLLSIYQVYIYDPHKIYKRMCPTAKNQKHPNALKSGMDTDIFSHTKMMAYYLTVQINYNC